MPRNRRREASRLMPRPAKRANENRPDLPGDLCQDICSPKASDPDGIRTRVAALKGPCPRPLDDGASGEPSGGRYPQNLEEARRGG